MFSPFLLLGTTTQRQWINIHYFTDFVDDPSAPASQIVVELQSRHIQVIASAVWFGLVIISVQVYSGKGHQATDWGITFGRISFRSMPRNEVIT